MTAWALPSKGVKVYLPCEPHRALCIQKPSPEKLGFCVFFCCQREKKVARTENTCYIYRTNDTLAQLKKASA